MTTESTGAAPEAPPVAVETPTAPVEAVETATDTQATTPEQQLTPGHGKSGAARRVAERMAKRDVERQRAEAAREKALGQPRKEAGTQTEDGKPAGGQFTKEQTDAAAAAAPASTPDGAPAAPPEKTAPTTPAAAKAPDGMVDVPLPEGHPWRDRGRSHIRVAKEFENETRAGINAAMRLRDVESERDRLARENLLAEARQKALSGDLPKVASDPKWQALIEQVRAAPGFGDEMAEQILALAKANEEWTVVRAESEAARNFELTQMMTRLEDEVMGQASQLLEVWSSHGEMWRVPHLFRQYVNAVDARNQREGRDIPPSRAEFFEWIKPHYRQDPRVQQRVQALRDADRQREEAKIRADERAKAERERAEAAKDAALRHAAKPPLARVPQRQSQAPVPPPPPAEPAAPQQSRRKAAQQRAREIATRMLGRNP